MIVDGCEIIIESVCVVIVIVMHVPLQMGIQIRQTSCSFHVFQFCGTRRMRLTLRWPSISAGLGRVPFGILSSGSFGKRPDGHSLLYSVRSTVPASPGSLHVPVAY